MKRWRFWFVVAFVLSMFTVTAWALSRARAAERAQRVAEADRTAVELERDGWKASAEATEAELISSTTRLQGALEAAKKVGGIPLMTSTTTTGERTFRLPPCETSSAGTLSQSSPDAAPRPALVVDSVPAEGDCPLSDPDCLAVSAHVETAVVVDGAGRPQIKTSVLAKLRTRSWKTEGVLPEGTVTAKHDPTLREALDAFYAAKAERRLEILAGGSISDHSTGWLLGASGGGRRFGWWALGERATVEAGNSFASTPYGDYSLPGFRETEIRVLGGVRISIR